MKKRTLPWLLFFIGFLSLDMFNGIIAGACFVIGIMMLIERRWPENWDSDITEQKMVKDREL